MCLIGDVHVDRRFTHVVCRSSSCVQNLIRCTRDNFLFVVTLYNMERQLITYPTWERYTVLSHVISHLTIRDRRLLFHMARGVHATQSDLFFPHYGFTLSEFAVWYTLGDTRRKTRKSKGSRDR